MKPHGVSRSVEIAWAVTLFCVGAVVLGWSATRFPHCSYGDLLFGRHPLHFRMGTGLLVAMHFVRVFVLGQLWLLVCGALASGRPSLLRWAWPVACLGIADAALVFVGFAIVDVGAAGWTQLGAYPRGHVRVGALAWLLVWAITLSVTRRSAQVDALPRPGQAREAPAE
jgi:hypothetical protein